MAAKKTGSTKSTSKVSQQETKKTVKKSSIKNSDDILIDNNIKKNRAIKIKLANLTSTNPKDVCIKSKLSKYSIDISKFVDFNDLYSFYIDPNEQLTFKNLTLNAKDIHDYLLNTKTIEDFLNCLDDNDIAISEAKKNELYKDFDGIKNKIIQNISNSSFDQKRKFDIIIKQNKNILDNTGVYSLFIATNFVVGCTTHGILLNAPLILYPVELSYNGGTFIVEHIKSNFVVNEKLFTLLKKEYSLNWVINDVAKITDVKKLIALITKDTGVKVEFKSTNKHEFVEFSNNDILKMTTFHVYDSALLGIYEPSGGALKENLEKLVEMNVDPFVGENEYSETRFINEETKGQSLIEIGRPLNIYQKYAIRSSLAQNTLIYGPPGTGKSEVIANIIVNAMFNLKSVLIVSEKKAALNVLHERLQEIAKFALFIYDLDDKQSFYSKIAELGDKIINFRYNEKGVVVAKNINLKNKIESFEEWIKVQESHKELRSYIHELLVLNKSVDSLGTTFSQYVDSNVDIDKKLLKYTKDTNMIEKIEELMYKYSFINPDNFFSKFNDYRDFMLTHSIRDKNISVKTLKKEKFNLISLQINHNILEYIIENEKIINSDLKKLNLLFEKYNLNNDNEFKSLLNSNFDLLIKQYLSVQNFKKSYPQLANDTDFVEFMIEQYDKLLDFVSTYEKADQDKKVILYNNFLNSKKISKFSLFKSKSELTPNDIYNKIQAMKSFAEIPHARYKYILDFIKSKIDYIYKNNVIIYSNQWLLKPYIKDLGIKHLVFFDEEDVDVLTPVSSLNGEMFNKFKIIINYEREIIVKFHNLMMVDVNKLITKDRNLISLATKEASKHLEELYIEYLKSVISKLTDDEWKKMQEVFSIAKRNSRNNSSIKDFVQHYYKELSVIFPIWISLPELVAQTLPLEKGMFDYGIFDEASQMFVERSYPLVYRCKNNIVAGDDKQLKPTSFFSSRVNENSSQYDLADNDQVDSLLDRAKVSLWSSYNLRNHYRSEHRDLIQFSNDFVYDHKLHFATKNGINGSGIDVVNVKNAVSVDSVNDVEAHKVIDLLNENIDKYNKIIVITFGVKQSQYIETLIFKLVNSTSPIYRKLSNNELIITNLENVQGNEGDLVILSTTFAPGLDGLFRNSYGPLMMDGGINRLNVAITRAKQKMIIVKSICASDMSVNRNNINAVVLRSFFEYCDRINDKENINDSTSTNKSSSSMFKNEIGRWLLSILYDKQNELELVNNYDIGSRVMDFAIIDKKTNKVELALLIHKWKKDMSLQEYLESVDNFYFFVDRGYKSIRIEEYNWIYNSKEIKTMINNAIKTIMKEKQDLLDQELQAQKTILDKKEEKPTKSKTK